MSKNSTVLFRADSSSTIGTGHIMRDLVFAEKYAKKGHNIIFATQNLAGNINHKIKEEKYQLEILKSHNFKELNKLIKKLKVDMLVIDHYEIDYKFEKKIKEKNKNLKILSFDDTYEKHYCDILLNHNIGADEYGYKNLVPSTCRVKCGSKYTLLREEFIKERGKKKKISKNKVIFLAMGGADHSNINIDILKVLKNFKKIKVNIVTTTANKNLEKLKKYVKYKKQLALYVDTDKIAKLMRNSDLAIVTPSVILNEVMYMGLDFIAIKTAYNQKDIYKFLKKKKYATLKTFQKQSLSFAFKSLLST